MLSNDGSEWTHNTQFNPSNQFADLSYVNGIWLFAGWFSSVDGIEWTIESGPGTLTRIIYHDRRFIGLHNGNIVTSDNGIDWESQYVDTRATLRDIAVGNGCYIAVGTVASSIQPVLILRSNDGVSWSHANHDLSGFGIAKVAFGNGQFVAIDERGHIATSRDGWIWRSPNNLQLQTHRQMATNLPFKLDFHDTHFLISAPDSLGILAFSKAELDPQLPGLQLDLKAWQNTWLGPLMPVAESWAYHPQRRWIMPVEQNFTDGLWHFDPNLGSWVWALESIHPWIWVADAPQPWVKSDPE